MDDQNSSKFLLCSKCFQNEGLRISSSKLGSLNSADCKNCGSTKGTKLSFNELAELSRRFFVWGTLHRCKYGAAPRIQFNDRRHSDISPLPWLADDLNLIEKATGFGFFDYGPRLWMVGEIEPLKDLENPSTRKSVIQRILDEYPNMDFNQNCTFYRIRKNPQNPSSDMEYDSPPNRSFANGRLNFPETPILYGSQNLDVCIHECRVSVEDDIFVATLKPNSTLRLLDLSVILNDGSSEFESLDMAIHMLFLAGGHSYDICRDIAKAAFQANYDGIIFPSFFSLICSGHMPFETAYGLSYRIIPQMAEYENSKIIQNLALFGNPIRQNKVSVKCINKLMLAQIQYHYHMGPVFT